ncbi:hypothetical protein OH492_02735 [Vibrio chagasii]|nr:hypothetical protein [Vibrio chagasii]
MVGFAASCYQRGIDFVQIPTTLLSSDLLLVVKPQNHPLGKTYRGAFYQPKRRFTDNNCLSTLPEREFAAALLKSSNTASFTMKLSFDWLEQNLEKLYLHLMNKHLSMQPLLVVVQLRLKWLL